MESAICKILRVALRNVFSSIPAADTNTAADMPMTKISSNVICFRCCTVFSKAIVEASSAFAETESKIKYKSSTLFS
ncbi:hypothetical protein SDC9_134856 [bioreactor metagenome]|uniref:Uncharacterized protein n=1 Tax=bioreactor metagenome TaxID=1076179 RepID=A0A645DEG7_9ZZZZ